MNFITVKELYKNSEAYLDKTIEAVVAFLGIA